MTYSKITGNLDGKKLFFNKHDWLKKYNFGRAQSLSVKCNIVKGTPMFNISVDDASDDGYVSDDAERLFIAIDLGGIHPGLVDDQLYELKISAGKLTVHVLPEFDPNEIKKFNSPPIENPTDLSTSGFSIKPEEGNLLLFPSYLYHDVGKNLSDEDRIVISFNVSIIPTAAK